MGMTIKEAIAMLKTAQIMLINPTTQEPISDLYYAYKMIIEFAEKYQQLQADYENRLKADMVAMLEELDLQLDEMKIIRPQHNMPKYQIDPYRHGVNDSKKKIQQKINALKE